MTYLGDFWQDIIRMTVSESKCWIGDPVEQPCHGCNGKGWIEMSNHTAQRCPLCLGSGKYKDNILNPYPLFPIQPYPLQPIQPYNPPVINPMWPPYTIISSSGKDVGKLIMPNSNDITSKNVSIWKMVNDNE